uniref:Cytochrome c oxidase subunit 2 n=1 Tax=Echinolaelaps echidninus TaxID=2759148 RepID=A0AB74RXR0_9ACAR
MMTFWSSLVFMNANSPMMEELIFFHDHSMIVLVFIIMMIMYMIMDIINNSFYNRFLLENHDIEILWTVLPALMLIFIAVPSLRLLYLMEEFYQPELSMKILGHQWYWTYEYSDFLIEFDSFMIPENDLEKNKFRLLEVDNNFIIPNLMGLRLLISSTDVIHSWTIPSMGVKVDAVPGRLNQIFLYSYRPGLFYGQCSEICGANHSFMPIVLEVTSLENFINWVKNY